jgi:outer membrane protein TolC
MLRSAPRIWGIVLSLLTGAWAEDTTLDLSYCLEAAMAHNRELLQSRARLEQVGGGRLVVRSRLLPHLGLAAQYQSTRDAQSPAAKDQVASQLLLTQRLVEFGPEAAQEVQLRSELRQAVHDYQDKVHQVLASAWELFHLILLQDQQIATRRQSRASFQSIFERQQARFESRLATEEELLSAQLNVLNEDLAINNLERAQFNNKMELLRLIDQPIGTQIKLDGTLTAFTMEQEAAVELALASNVEVALLAGRVDDQQRVVRELNWEYSPDVSLSTGVEDGRKNASLSIDKEGKTWGLNLSSGYDLKEETPPAEFRNQAQWSTQVEARIPLLEGGARVGREAQEKARLRQLQVQMRDLRAETELRVRQAFQSLLEAEGQQGIQFRRVEIVRRRLEINQILKDKGQADESLLEQVRNQFFNEQDTFFRNQETYIRRQAALRRQIGYVE